MAVQTPVYLDHHATTPVDPRVLEAMRPWFSEQFGNAASRSHAPGRQAEEAVEASRGAIAGLIGGEPRELIFTSGATEADNLALLGVARAARARGRDKVVVSSVEHRAVLDPAAQLEREGFAVVRLPVDGTGRVDPDEVGKHLDGKTALCSVMFVNNEVGTIQPVKEIGAVCRAKGVPFHCDAAQGIGRLPLSVKEIPVDLVSLTAHKIYGPKGIGALWIRRADPPLKLQPLLFGGGHERGLRSGTLDVPGIVGFAAASGIYARERDEERARVSALRDRLHEGLAGQLEGLALNGPPASGRHPGNLNLSVAWLESEALLGELRGLALSSGAACSSAQTEPSHVLKAMGIPPGRAAAALRFCVGRFTTGEEIEFAIAHAVEVVRRLRERSPLYEMHKRGIDPAARGWGAA